MSSIKKKRIAGIAFLAVLVVVGFVSRMDNFSKTREHTIDEILYYSIGVQLTKDPTDYTAIPYGEYLASTGRVLPEYFSRPLFKHPPVFLYLAAGMMKIFGPEPMSAVSIALLADLFILVLVYLSGAIFFCPAIGALAAFFYFIDPVAILCSQKVWMDSTVSFFMFLSSFLFFLGLRKQKEDLFLWSGLATACAGLTKYPGLLVLLATVIYVFIYQREIFRNKKFVLGLLLPFVLQLPWLFWNYRVYGMGFLNTQMRIHGLTWGFCLSVMVLVGSISIFVIKARPAVVSFVKRKISLGQELGQRVRIIAAVLFFGVLLKNVIHSLSVLYVPENSLFPGLFYLANKGFYFGKLLDFSFLYFLSFLTFFFPTGEKNPVVPFLKVNAVVILAFYTYWGNFQSRYILAAIPYLILLGAQLLFSLVKFFGDQPEGRMKRVALAGFLFVFSIMLWRAGHIYQAVVVSNNVCYF